MKKIHTSYYKFFLMLAIIIVICLLKEDMAFVRLLLYIIAGGVWMAKTRQEKVTFIEYFALVLLIYIDVSFFVPILMPMKSISAAILKIGGLFGIIHFLTGALISYMILPFSKRKSSICDSGKEQTTAQ